MSEYQLAPSILRRDGGTQPRAVLDEETIFEYAMAMTAGDVFPAVVAFHDGDAYWLADGFHRVNAALRAGVVLLPVDVRQGSQRDAVLYSAGVNATHGLRRTNNDKRRAVVRLLSDPEWSQWSDREIGRRCAVSHQFVNNLRSELSVNGLQISGRRVTRGGAEYTMQTAGIGQPAQSEQIGRQPASQAFAPIWELGHALYAHLRASIPMGDDWLYVAEVALVELRERGDDAPRWPEVVAAMPPCRKGDLVQAIHNTLEQVRQAQRLQAKPADAAAGEPAARDDAPYYEMRKPISAGTLTGPALITRFLDPSEVTAAEEPAPVEPDPAGFAGAGETGWYAEPVEAPVEFRSPTRIGSIEIHHEDARALSNVVLPGSVDLIVTSPPYNTGGVIEYDGHDDDLGELDYLLLLDAVWKECYLVMTPGARICVNVPFGMGRQPWRPVANSVMTGLTLVGFELDGQVVWDKNTTGNRTTWGSWRRPTSPALRDTCEAVIVAHKPGLLVLPAGVLVANGDGADVSPWLDAETFMSLTQDHWQIAPESAQRVGHPAPFPVKLAEGLIRLYGWPGCTILDPFAGSGTVAVAALGLPGGAGCPVVLVDQSAKYCLRAADRVHKVQGRLAL